MFLVMFLAYLLQDPLALAVMAGFSLLVGLAVATSKIGSGASGRVAHEGVGAGGAPTTEVVVDVLWTRIAVGYDIAWMVVGTSAVVALGSMGSAAFHDNHQGIPPDIGWALLVGAATSVFGQYAHWRATRPRPRRRVRVPNLVPVPSHNR